MVYSLDKIDRKILYELDKNCRISDNQLAKIVGRSREAVRHRIKKLVDDEIIESFQTSINPSKMGYMVFKMYFQLANIPQLRKQFYQYMENLPGMYWFGGNDGVWDFHCTIYAEDLETFNRLKNQVYTHFKDLIIKRDIGVLINVRQYVKKYLIDIPGFHFKERLEPTMFADIVIHNKPDELDRKILNILVKDARISLVALAQKTNSTVDIARHRMKKMKELDIIIQYRIAINHTKLGYEMFKAFIYFHNLSEKDEQRLIEYAKQSTKILYLIRQLSAWDVELELMCNNYDEFNQIINEIRLEFANCLRNYEFVVMKEDVWYFWEKKMF